MRELLRLAGLWEYLSLGQIHSSDVLISKDYMNGYTRTSKDETTNFSPSIVALTCSDSLYLHLMQLYLSLFCVCVYIFGIISNYPTA